MFNFNYPISAAYTQIIYAVQPVATVSYNWDIVTRQPVNVSYKLQQNVLIHDQSRFEQELHNAAVDHFLSEHAYTAGPFNPEVWKDYLLAIGV